MKGKSFGQDNRMDRMGGRVLGLMLDTGYGPLATFFLGVLLGFSTFNVTQLTQDKPLVAELVSLAL